MNPTPPKYCEVMFLDPTRICQNTPVVNRVVYKVRNQRFEGDQEVSIKMKYACRRCAGLRLGASVIIPLETDPLALSAHLPSLQKRKGKETKGAPH